MSHTPVLLDESLDALNLQPFGTYFDATFGRGGHSQALLQRCPSAKLFVGDRDKSALESAHNWTIKPTGMLHCNYSALASLFEPQSLDGILADLGVCSAQIDTPERGFSFNHPGPLDMRMDKTQDRTLASLLSSTKESDLANIIYQYGQERYSRRVAPVILEAFHAGKIQTTADLAHYVSKVVKQSPLEKKHPATRTFQALRIAVNNELEHLSLFLKAAPTVLKNGGRLALITFHSLEYQIVKEHFMDKLTVMSYEAQHFKMVKIAHPLFPSALEQSSNPRSRSARLHIYEKRVI